MTGYFAALICAAITFGFALFYVLLILGAPLGEYILGGQYRVLPPKVRVVSGVLSCLFVFAGLIYLQKGSIINIGLDSHIAGGIIIVFTLFFAYAIFGNAVLTKSKKEKYVMTPISILSFICSVLVLFFT